MMVIDNKYDFFDLVYLKTDVDQRQRMVTRMSVSPNGITYELTCGTQASWHFENEIALEKDVLITSTSA